MARVTPPYFFDEFLLPVRRKEPSERERALGLTLRDLDWLHTMYYATDQARQDTTLRDAPMAAEKLWINLRDKPAIPLAGAFMLSPSPDDKKALLYTPYGGIEVFDSRANLLIELRSVLKNKQQSVDLLSFLSIKEQRFFASETAFTLSASPIEGAIMEDQEKTILAAQAQNVQGMLDQLRKTPSLEWMLDTVLAIMARSYFPGLDQRDTRVNSFFTSPEHNALWIGSAPLSEVLLQYYLSQAWPNDQTRTFVNPRHDTRHFTAAQQAEDLQRWESLVTQTSGILYKLLSSLLQTWWNEDIGGGASRIEYFTQVMSDKFRADLLFKRQNGIVSSRECHQLLAVFLPDQAARRAWHSPLSIDKVSIQAPFQHYVELAATLLISNSYAYLYTQSRGLQVVKDLNDLNDTLLSMLKAAGYEDELLNFLSLDERSLYIGMDEVQISGLPVIGSVFGELVEDISAKQLNNLEHALAVYRRSNGVVDLAALLDCALDMRQMLDSRLLALDAEGRWSLHPVTSANGRPSTVQAERAKLQLQALSAADALVTEQRRDHPTLRRLAAQALNTELNKHQLPVKAEEVYINTYATAAAQMESRVPVTTSNMLDHFIERLAGTAEPIEDTPRTGFYSAPLEGVASQLSSLTSRTFNTVIEQTLAPFINHDIRTLPRLFLESHREPMNQALMLGLRSEAELRLLNKTLPGASHAILDTVLRPDSMTRLNRHALNGFLPDAYSLTLKVGTADTLHVLANCFVLTERGGLDTLRSGHAILWTPQSGHEPFASIRTLRDALEHRLALPDARLPLLQNLPISLRAPHQTYRLGPLRRIDEHLLNNRQQSHLDYVLDNLGYWLDARLGPKPLQDCLDAEMQRAAPSNLGRAAAVARTMIHQQALPVWLGMAAPEEQLLHAELLEQWRISAPDEQDYLHSLPPLREQVAQKLRTLLAARYVDQKLNPDDILIPARLALNGHTLSLTDFAMRHLPDLQSDAIRPYSRTHIPLPATLDGVAVVQMVRQVDIAQTYKALLNTHLIADTDDARKRRSLFCRQLPWQLLRHAHEEKLEERLSAAAWHFIVQVVDMPDGVARASVGGASAMIRPLELVATTGATPVQVRGLYLIGPQAEASGPLVLYSPYRPRQVFKEYAREENLLDELNSPGPLQNWVILQLDAPHQATYRNLLKTSPRRGLTDIKLASSPIRRNLLPQLFSDNAQQLLKMLACQFDKEGRDHWKAVTSLLGHGITRGLQLLAGKLQFPLVVWRSFKLFHTSAEDLQQRRWSSGLKHFVQGVASMASVSKELDTLLASATNVTPPSSTADTPDTADTLATSIATLDVTQPLRTRMNRFESAEVALADLQLSPASQLYLQPINNRHYVPVAGKVYPVKQAGERWRIAQGDDIGPYVQRNTHGEWILDLTHHSPRHGPALSRYIGRWNTRTAERDAINIEAVGMLAIRALSTWKALCINEALNVATYYAVTCKRNILLFTKDPKPGSRVGLFLTEMFGVLSPSPSQLARIERSVDEILDELVNSTLTAPDSGRFVTGTSIWQPLESYAFTLPDDAQRKIYLLDRFFDPRLDVYQNHLCAPFDISAHARASVLIHEVTHLKCHTEDLAYLDSMRPFQDLICVDTLGGQRLHTSLSDLRATALSTLTPASVLFKTWDSLSRRWEDLGRFGATHARDKVLKLTGAKTLDDARQIFMSNADKRIDTILVNADSLTYLITHLGRVLDEGA